MSEISSPVVNAVFKYILKRDRRPMFSYIPFLTGKKICVPEIIDR